jgi:hypothetical protein
MINVTDAVRTLDRDLHQLFGSRLKSVVAYRSVNGAAGPTPTLAIVNSLTAEDLRACASRVAGWHEAGLDTPLLVAEQEFERSLDAFPFEFGGILADHIAVSGVDPFAGLRVDPADLRRACEVQTRSHLLHLREGYIETEGRSDALAELISHSAAPLAALLQNVARLLGFPACEVEEAARHVEDACGLSPGNLGEVAGLASGKTLSSERAREMFPRYLDAICALTNYLDRWIVNDQ